MAGDWIKMRCDLHTHPKVVRISSACQADILRTVGGLHAVWCLFDVHSTDGHIDGFDLQTLDNSIRFPGFACAMSSVGWLEVSDTGITCPRFNEHNSKSAKRRATDSETKRRVRKMSAKCPKNVRKSEDVLRTREEKRREEKILSSKEESRVNETSKTKKQPRKKPVEIDIPDNLKAHPDFDAAWDRWQQHRVEIGKKLTPTSRNMLLSKLSKLGPIKAITEIDRAITSGWTGIHEDKNSDHRSGRNGSTQPDCLDAANYTPAPNMSEAEIGGVPF